MGRDCDFCSKRFEDDRFEVSITIQRGVRPIGSRDFAYGPFTYYHAPWYIESRDENKRNTIKLRNENPDEFRQCEAYMLDFKGGYVPVHVYSSDADSPFALCFSFGEGVCLNCALKYMPYFQADGTPNEAMRQHIHRHFWEDPEPRMTWFVSGKECTRAEFFQAFAERQFAPDTTDDGA